MKYLRMMIGLAFWCGVVGVLGAAIGGQAGTTRSTSRQYLSHLWGYYGSPRRLELRLPKTTVARYAGSFFKLRKEIDHLLNDLQPPRLVVYVPLERTETDSALIELDCAINEGSFAEACASQLLSLVQHVPANR